MNINLLQHYIVVLSLMNFGCNFQENYRGVSDDINFSKRHGLFIQEYVFEHDTIVIEDTIVLIYKSIWLEKAWKHGDDNSVIVGNKYQLIIDMDERSKIPDFRSFNVGISGKNYLRPCNDYCLMTDLDTIPTLDSITWPIQRESHLMEGSFHDVFGELKIFKTDKSN